MEVFQSFSFVMNLLTLLVISGRVDENSTFKSVIEKHFESRADNVAMITELRHFCRREIAEVKLYFQKEPCEVPMNTPLFINMATNCLFSRFSDLGFRVLGLGFKSTSKPMVLIMRRFLVLQGNSKVFYELNVEDTVCSQLAHKTVYEFPVIHVALNPDPIKFPVVVTKPLSIATPAPPVFDVEPVDEEEDPVGKFFREEEIEEGEFVP